MDKTKISFEAFNESLYQVISEQLDKVGMALVRVNDQDVGIFKAPATLPEDDGDVVKNTDNVVSISQPKTLH